MRAVSEIIVSVFGLDVTDLSGLIITTATASALLQLASAAQERRAKKNEFQKSTILGIVPQSRMIIIAILETLKNKAIDI